MMKPGEKLNQYRVSQIVCYWWYWYYYAHKPDSGLVTILSPA
ncbi:MAG: hypothetical protein ACE5KJ_07305 [Candidatus Zixiibacteriota bacterium]